MKDIIRDQILHSCFDSIHNSQNTSRFHRQSPLKPKSKPKRKSSKLLRTHLRLGKERRGGVKGEGVTLDPSTTIVHKISRKCMLFRLAS